MDSKYINRNITELNVPSVGELLTSEENRIKYYNEDGFFEIQSIDEIMHFDYQFIKPNLQNQIAATGANLSQIPAFFIKNGKDVYQKMPRYCIYYLSEIRHFLYNFDEFLKNYEIFLFSSVLAFGH